MSQFHPMVRHRFGQQPPAQPSWLSNPMYLMLIAAAGLGALLYFRKGFRKNPSRRKKAVSKRRKKRSPRSRRSKIAWRVQSVQLPIHRFTLKKARAWLKRAGYKHKDVDKTKNYWRFRQESPKHYVKSKIRTKWLSFDEGVMATVGQPKHGFGSHIKKALRKRKTHKGRKRRNAEIQTLDGGVIYV